MRNFSHTIVTVFRSQKAEYSESKPCKKMKTKVDVFKILNLLKNSINF